MLERPRFQRLVGEVCTVKLLAVFCIEASRLARNGRDWHHLIELCPPKRDAVGDYRKGIDELNRSSRERRTFESAAYFEALARAAAFSVTFPSPPVRVQVILIVCPGFAERKLKT